jgi:putative peptide zinc metalloprotease protein
VIGDAFPKVRRSLHYVRQVQDGKPVIVVKDPTTLRYFRFGETEAWLMQRMDGSRSFARIVDELRESRGVSSTVTALEPFHRRLKELGLAERTQAERSVLVLEAVRDRRRSRLHTPGNTLLRMRFSLGDPDELFNRLIERIRFFWSPAFVGFSLAAFALYALVIATHWGPFVQGVAAMYAFSEYTIGFFLTLYLTALVVIVIHELGHGLTCKHFGGEVHELGFMLLYFSPAMFCNVNDAWTFEKRAHRLWVTFAGGWIQLLIAAAAAIVWILVEPGTLAHRIAFAAMLIGGGLALVVNFNPLIPLDGYYALMDWLEIPNLRARSFEYLGAFLKRSVLRLDVPLPAVTARERKVFLTYGFAALLYTTLLLSLVGLWVAALLIGWIGAWGWVLVLFVAWRLGRKPAQRAVRVLRVFSADKLAGAPRWPLLVTGAGLLVAALLLALMPWTIRAEGRAVVEPVQRIWLRPGDEGRVERLLVAEGSEVGAGDPVVVLRNPRLELEWTHARAAVEALEREAADARARGNTELARRAELRLAADRLEFAELDRRRDALILRAPFAGRIVTPHPEELIGAGAAPGDSLLELWSTGTWRVRVLLPERDAGEITSGSPLGLKFPVRAGWIWRTRVEQVSPAAREGQVELLAPLVLPDDAAETELLRGGMVGRAKVVVRETRVAGALLRWLQHTVRLDWLL